DEAEVHDREIDLRILDRLQRREDVLRRELLALAEDDLGAVLHLESHVGRHAARSSARRSSRRRAVIGVHGVAHDLPPLASSSVSAWSSVVHGSSAHLMRTGNCFTPSSASKSPRSTSFAASPPWSVAFTAAT